MIILQFHLQPQFKYELFHILHIITTNITTTVTTREDGTEVLTEQITTSISSEPVTQCNALYQPEGPLSDQPPLSNYTQREQPPSYTLTPTS